MNWKEWDSHAKLSIDSSAFSGSQSLVTTIIVAMESKEVRI